MRCRGWTHFVPTDLKIRYLNALLAVGFDTLDFGSFVSPKAIPQLRDTAEVLARLDLSSTKTKLLAIVANQRGAEQAVGPSIRFSTLVFHCRYPKRFSSGTPTSPLPWLLRR